jgi:tetratricopeptide (TPR) repeat protein
LSVALDIKQSPGTAQALDAQRGLEEAAAEYRRALALRPDHAEAHCNLGTVLWKQRKLDEAAARLRHALALSPDYADAQFNLARVLYERGSFDAAISHCEKAVALQPGNAEVHSFAGRVLLETGQLQRARAACETAIMLSPRCGAYYLNLAHCDRFGAAGPHLAAMETLAQDAAALGEQDRIDLQFALGKAYADLGEPERAFRHLLEANALKRRMLAYDEAATLGHLERIRSIFDEALIRAGRGRGHPSRKPVFIVGMPRSGTSLVEQILASHPQVFGAGEIGALQDSVAELGSRNGRSLPFPELLAALPSHRMRELGGRYLARIRAVAPAAVRITDKMPGNFRFAGLIHLALPNARIIHVRRDPIDTCLSCFSTLFTAGGSDYSYDLGELGRCYRAYAGLMAHWRKVLPADAMLEVQYEHVVEDLEGQARRLVAYCGLDWDARCIAFHATPRAVRTASAAQVRHPIYRSSIGRWRPERELLQPLLDALKQTP